MFKSILLAAIVTISLFSTKSFSQSTEIHRIVGHGVNTVFSIFVNDACIDTHNFLVFKNVLSGKKIKFRSLPTVKFNYDSDFECVDSEVVGNFSTLKAVEVEAVVDRPDLAYWSLDLGNGIRVFLTQQNMTEFKERGVSTLQIGNSYTENNEQTITTVRAKLID